VARRVAGRLGRPLPGGVVVQVGDSGGRAARVRQPRRFPA